MKKFISSVFIALCILNAVLSNPAPRKVQDPDCTTVEECEALAKLYLEDEYEMESSRLCQVAVEADFAYNTDLEDPDKEQAVSDANIAYSKFQFDAWSNTISKFQYEDFTDESVKRQLKFLNIVGIAALNEEDLTNYNTLLGNMARIYGTAKICPFAKQDCDLATEGLSLEPDIERIISTSEDSKELEYAWAAWRTASGKLMRDMYKEYIALSNKAAKANGLKDNGDLWLARYEAEDFRDQVKEVWDDVKDLYKQLYGYVRFNLLQYYPEYFPEETDPIPAHLLGNMWAQQWDNIYPLVVPFPDSPIFDVTDKLKEKFPETLEGVTALFDEANEFFTGLGLANMSMSYGEKALIIKPDDREVTCHASAWDFCNKDEADYRIKMCTNVNQEDYGTVHHELGHIQYFLQYRNQPITFRDGANPGFHEAIGDVLSLSVATPKHMAKMGYMDDGSLTQESTINFLMQKALEKIAFLPFGYLIDAYRWSLFDGTTHTDRMEFEWLKIRNEIQGLVPPVDRSESDFDPGSKYHVPGNTPYIRYFVSFILQFQIHKALCIAAGEYDPESDLPEKQLYNCDIAGNPAAGAIMKTLLEKGFAENWQDVLQDAIGVRDMDGSAIKEYFTPLTDYLKAHQEQYGYQLDWKMDAFEKRYQGLQCSTPEECEAEAKTYLEDEYEMKSSRLCQAAAEADFAYNTDLEDPDKEQAVSDANIAYSKYQFEAWNTIIRNFEHEEFTDESVKRQLKFLNIVGIAALNEEDLTNYNTILGNMAKIYGSAKICPYAKQDCDLATEGLTLEPHIEEIMANSKDGDELAYVWTAWRDASGQHIRQMYMDYIALSNKAAVLNGMDDNSDLWLARYEADDFKEQVKAVWDDVKELYDQLYGYARFNLKAHYPQYFEEEDDPIPAHILGNMWSQTWESIYNFTIPFPEHPGFDVTAKLKEKFPQTLEGVTDLFDEANDFFTGLGLHGMEMSYGEKAVIIQPEDKVITCHASAWDFCNKEEEDYRIKMCTNVNQEDYVTVHHELGHIQYYLNYRHQPITFREGANPGFHEAIGDVLSLSVATPKHMAKLGYLDGVELTRETTLNFLMQKALEKISFLPFGYLIDAYRWSLFDGSTDLEKMEYEWLKIRNEIQGVVPPTMRSENDFDPGSKYHVPGNTPYIRYFASFILQFQIHKALCIAAGEYDPESDLPEKQLYNCDIAENEAAGTIMKTLLEKGASENWQDVLFDAIGARDMDGSAIKEYFTPLTEFLKEHQAEHEYSLGWKADAFEKFYNPNPSPTTTTPTTTTPTTTTPTTTTPTTTTPTTTPPTTTDPTATTTTPTTTPPTTPQASTVSGLPPRPTTPSSANGMHFNMFYMLVVFVLYFA